MQILNSELTRWRAEESLDSFGAGLLLCRWFDHILKQKHEILQLNCLLDIREIFRRFEGNVPAILGQGMQILFVSQ